MIESSIPAFEAFCENHDASSLFGDKEYINEYESVVRSYAQFASSRNPPGNGTVSRSMQMRWRNAGLSAIKCVSAADALSSLTGRQVDVIVPTILDNLWTEDDSFLDTLLERAQLEEKVDTEKALRRRTSVSTVKTAEGGDANALALSGTALDADKLAEEENGLLAMQCLKSIFVVPNRSQIHAGATALLKFISDRAAQGETVVQEDEKGQNHTGWAIKMFSIIARWAPVQDRYVILVVALDTLLRTPLKEGTLEQQWVVAAMIGSLLRSDINLIGLSVMDVLLGLIRQLRKVFQMHSDSSRSGSGSEEKIGEDRDAEVNPMRLKLRDRLELCIGDLATHVYYADQIWDMITAIVVRLKPGRSSSVLSMQQKESADNSEQVTTESTAPELGESQSSQLDTFFSYSAGRASALRAIKAIFLVANPQTKISGNIDLSRNRVPLQVWEGSQWLLRDANPHVRKAYVDALVTWLDRETTRKDCDAADDSLNGHHSSLRGRDFHGGRRAVSSASHRDKRSKTHRSNYLPLLHLAIFDNALQFVDYDNDMVLLHTLLAKLVFKLGVNALRYGLSMIYRLQEEIQDVEQPIHKVRISALCHGYFWTATEKFDLEASVVGRAIYNEISRRRNKGFWVEGINIPPPSLDQIGTPGQTSAAPSWSISDLEREELLPFDDRTSLIQSVATSYHESTLSPPSSPPTSPGRAVSQPVLGSTLTAASHGDQPSELPDAYRQDMLAEWSRDSLIDAVAALGKSESASGSRSGTTGTKANRLTINTAGVNGNGHLPVSPYGSLHNLRPLSAQAQIDRERFGSASKLRQSSVQGAVPPSPSSKAGIASVNQLKMVLSGNVSPRAVGIPGTGEDDDSAESMVSYDYSLSEASFNPPVQGEQAPTTTGDMLKRTISASAKGIQPIPQGSEQAPAPALQVGEDEDDVPPVPPLPNLNSYSGKNALLGDQGFRGKRSVSSRGGDGLKDRASRSRDASNKGGLDLQDLLRGIDSTSGEGSLGNVTKPPY